MQRLSHNFGPADMDGWVKRPSQSGAVVNVVFIHGVLSSGATCWTDPKGAFWPDLLGQELRDPTLGIYVFNYKTSLFSGSYSVSDVVDLLNARMEMEGLLNCCTLILVCHSMGGIVGRRFVVQRAFQLKGRGLRLGFFLIASPSLGSNYAKWVDPIARIIGHSQADILKFTQSNLWLNDLDKDFTNLKEYGFLNIFGKELVEDQFIILPGLLSRQVVEPFSGARNFGDSIKIADTDHFSIAKPSNERALQASLLVEFVKRQLNFGCYLDDDQRSKPDTGQNVMKPEDLLASFPDGPMVRNFNVRALAEAYAELIDPVMSAQIIREANTLRIKSATSNYRPASIKVSQLPNPQVVGGRNFWLQAFEQAALNGPKMLAALLLTVPADHFPSEAIIERQTLLLSLTKVN